MGDWAGEKRRSGLLHGAYEGVKLVPTLLVRHHLRGETTTLAERPLAAPL